MGQTMNCLWHKCGAAFTPTKPNKKFCTEKCKDAHNNWLKMTGVHFVPRAYYYVLGIANSRIPPITIDEMANEIILKQANADGEGITQDEAFGLKTDQP